MRLLHSETMVFPLQFLYVHYWIITNTFKRVTLWDWVTFPKTHFINIVNSSYIKSIYKNFIKIPIFDKVNNITILQGWEFLQRIEGLDAIKALAFKTAWKWRPYYTNEQSTGNDFKKIPSHSLKKTETFLYLLFLRTLFISRDEK